MEAGGVGDMIRVAGTANKTPLAPGRHPPELPGGHPGGHPPQLQPRGASGWWHTGSVLPQLGFRLGLMMVRATVWVLKTCRIEWSGLL